MQFHCRVATATGQVTEATFVAESEEHLRRDLEDKGLLLLAVRRSGLAGAPLGGSLARRRRVGNTEFLIFNQELATLLKAGLPLVQSLDILRKRVPNPSFRAILNDVHERVRS
ncbi:MAG: type II secretion system F family protein, partial [Planctomycetes bacterium]|nr:type II secretion system F family protein [Planctomycetota bacterium]